MEMVSMAVPEGAAWLLRARGERLIMQMTDITRKRGEAWNGCSLTLSGRIGLKRRMAVFDDVIAILNTYSHEILRPLRPKHEAISQRLAFSGSPHSKRRN